MSDKAVSTEDLCTELKNQSSVVDIARLEAILQTLVENKVEALKKEGRKASSVHSSPRSILNRLRLTSSSSQSTKDEGEPKTEETKEKVPEERHTVEISKFRKSALKHIVGESSPVRHQYRCRNYDISSNSEDCRNRSMNFDNIYIDNSCPSVADKPPTCYCNRDVNGQIMHFDDDYISMKIDGYGDVETDAIISEEALRRAKRKKRRRRKRKIKNRLAMHHAHFDYPADLHENYKNLTEDELSRRAKWTIVATAGLLLLMCLLLVGITLRMAPIIDEIVRKENEEFINALNKRRNSSSATPVQNVT
ncbi:hypothetical protein JTB14_019856 [Gonioctena quinquepunctata]|nr:hypothetical protein JTB14_019856 [Gonioctena quinquepunctata]